MEKQPKEERLNGAREKGAQAARIVLALTGPADKCILMLASLALSFNQRPILAIRASLNDLVSSGRELDWQSGPDWTWAWGQSLICVASTWCHHFGAN